METITAGTVVLVILAILVVAILAKGIRIIQQSEVMIIERLGRYHKTLHSGINIIIPIIDQPRSILWRYTQEIPGAGVVVRHVSKERIDLRETVYDFPKQNVITRDNIVTEINALIYFQIMDPVRSVYEISNLPQAIEKLTQTSLRNVIGDLDLDQTLTSRDTINSRLREILDEATNKWGVKVNRVELQDINPPRDIRDAMEKQMRAERDKRAMILEAEGTKQSQILHAEGQMEAQIDRSEPVKIVDVEQASRKPAPLKLSQIASEIEYYTVGDARFTVTQAIELPDSNAFITFNNPRIYYRKQGIPSKRYGFKALAYKWNNEMNGQNMFYDKKTTRMYVALSGKTQETRRTGTDSIPCISVLPPLDTMLTIQSYIFPESPIEKYPLGRRDDKLLGFSSTGYTLCNQSEATGEPDGITTFNLQGDTLCKFRLKEGELAPRTMTDNIPFFQTFYWNTGQDRMTFMMPYCDTVYQLRNPQTVAPLYAIRYGEQGLNLKEMADAKIPKGKMWLKTFYENPKGLFMGLYQKGGRIIANWLGWEYDYKPSLTHQAVYLKEEGRTVMLPADKNRGFIKDLDDGMPFWPDGQTDDCLYMLRTVTEMRELVKRTGSPKQKKLVELLDNPKVHERDYVMIVVR